MDSNVIPISEGITIIVKSSGDLFLQGESPMEVRFQSSEDRIRVNQSKDTLYIETHANLDLVVPRSIPVIVEKTGGSAFLQDLDQPVVIQKVGGDLALRRIGTLRLEKVGGSCIVDGANQPVTIQKIGGDLTMRGVVTPLVISSIGGSANLQVLGGGPIEARAGGDIRVFFSEVLGGSVNLKAGASAEAYLPPAVNAKIILDSGAEKIKLNLTRQENQAIESLDSRRYEFSIGEGGTSVEIRAGGDILMSDQEQTVEPVTYELDRREKAWKDMRERQGHSSWSGGFGFDRTSAWADMISRRAQEAARRAEQRAHSAMRRTEDQIRQAAERELRRVETQYGVPPSPPFSPPPPTPKATEQERLMILTMLQENKITVEQAERLLAALEGKFE